MPEKKGFTLLELITVIIVLGILVGIAVVTMPGAIRRSYSLEATAALTSIRAQMRLTRAQTGSFDVMPVGGNIIIAPVPVIGNVYGFSPGDLTGAYFVDADYTITAVGPDTFTARVAGTRPLVRDIVITIDENGTVTGI